MADEKDKKPNTLDLLKKAAAAPKHIARKQESKVVPVEEKPKEEKPRRVTPVSTNKVGRPTEKTPDIEYVKVSARIPAETRRKIKEALAGKFYGKVKTQDEFINKAILFYIESMK